MNQKLYDLKKILHNLETTSSPAARIKLLEEMMVTAETYKKSLSGELQDKNVGTVVNKGKIKVEKISEETFLYKAVAVKNYYEGDYLERFAAIRTSDLKTSGALELHNKFWRAHEIVGGNIFATVPLALITHEQSRKLQSFHWDRVDVDVYEVKQVPQANMTKGQMINLIREMFHHYILIREVCGDIFMVLHYKL